MICAEDEAGDRSSWFGRQHVPGGCMETRKRQNKATDATRPDKRVLECGYNEIMPKGQLFCGGKNEMRRTL